MRGNKLRKVVVLCSPEDSGFLEAILEAQNPRLSVISVHDIEALKEAVSVSPADTRLLGFGTPVVVPGHILDALPSPSYNFHPAPPAFPGKYPAPFAFYEGVAQYGATVHEMVAKVDAGPIVRVAEFVVPPAADLRWLGRHGRKAAIGLFMELAPALACCSDALQRIDATWGQRRCTQQALDALCALPMGIDESELARRIAAFGHIRSATFHVTLQGYRFELAAATP